MQVNNDKMVNASFTFLDRMFPMHRYLELQVIKYLVLLLFIFVLSIPK
jgi:hypothetical protein